MAEQKRQIAKVATPYVFTFFATTPKGHVRKKRAGTPIRYTLIESRAKDG